MKVAILSDGIPGHVNQSIGIINLLSEDISIEFEIIPLHQKYSFLRALIKVYKKFLSRNLSTRNAKIIKSLYEDIKIKNVDLLIATGGNTAHICASLGKIYSVMTIQNGKASGILSSNYKLHITLDKRKGPSNIRTFFPPNTTKLVNKTSKNNKVLFLIGGNGSGYTFQKNDFNVLINNIKKFSTKNNISPIIVTSRRTPFFLEDLMHAELKDICDSSSVWYHKDNSNFNLQKLFNESDMIFVTEESSTMIAEAICSGLPVVTIYPEKHKKEKRHQDQVYKYIKTNLITRISIKSELEFNDCNIRNNIKKIKMEKQDLKNKILKGINNE
ncbi:MAG: hypothetical protein DBW99_04695 [SAR86 cluster bacterium]|jgi:mitochondrial fission protein ELM1|nr:hypothetical protein [Gammaproteobacteria bacterium]RCL34985.1 MAG: hypothetical protein DBW99_04695 [SAR86 cluster bacterium]URQ69271.1 mitochondrial fission ELM1 family protein [SAR86 cluster bacterium]|tara:strand:- start:778 stop:1764 length:987 start_codon:yes stop_codon:yes gene_type:complete